MCRCLFPAVGAWHRLGAVQSGPSARKRLYTVVQTLQNFINGEFVTPAGTGMLDIVNPATGDVVAQVARLGAGRRRRRHDRRQGRLQELEARHPGPAPAHAAQARRRRRGQQRRTRRGPAPQHRPGPVPDRLRGSRRGRGPAALLRRRRPHPGGQVRRRVLRGPHLLRPARADRRRRAGGAVELPLPDGHLEDRPRARRRQHRGAQALGHHPGIHPGPGPPRRRTSSRPAC